MAKRKYNKKSDYWKRFDKDSQGAVQSSTATKAGGVAPDLLGEPFYTSDASYTQVAKARTQLAKSERSR